MVKFLLYAIIIIAVLVLLIILDLLYAFYYGRRCNYCNNRMKYLNQEKDEYGNFLGWKYYCPNCDVWEEVTPEDIGEKERQSSSRSVTDTL